VRGIGGGDAQARAGQRSKVMKLIDKTIQEGGKIGYALLWILGVPLPVLLLIYLLRGH